MANPTVESTRNTGPRDGVDPASILRDIASANLGSQTAKDLLRQGNTNEFMRVMQAALRVMRISGGDLSMAEKRLDRLLAESYGALRQTLSQGGLDPSQAEIAQRNLETAYRTLQNPRNRSAFVAEAVNMAAGDRDLAGESLPPQPTASVEDSAVAGSEFSVDSAQPTPSQPPGGGASPGEASGTGPQAAPSPGTSPAENQQSTDTAHGPGSTPSTPGKTGQMVDRTPRFWSFATLKLAGVVAAAASLPVLGFMGAAALGTGLLGKVAGAALGLTVGTRVLSAGFKRFGEGVFHRWGKWVAKPMFANVVFGGGGILIGLGVTAGATILGTAVAMALTPAAVPFGAVLGLWVGSIYGMKFAAQTWKRGANQIKRIVANRLAAVVRLAKRSWDDPDEIAKWLDEARNHFAEYEGVNPIIIRKIDAVLDDPRKTKVTPLAMQLLERRLGLRRRGDGTLIEKDTSGIERIFDLNGYEDTAIAKERFADMGLIERRQSGGTTTYHWNIPELLRIKAVVDKGGGVFHWAINGGGPVVVDTLGNELVGPRDLDKEFNDMLREIFPKALYKHRFGTWDPFKFGFHDWDTSQQCLQFFKAKKVLKEFAGQFILENKLAKSSIKSAVLGELAGVPIQHERDDTTGDFIANVQTQVYSKKFPVWYFFEKLLDNTVLHRDHGAKFLVYGMSGVTIGGLGVAAVGSAIATGAIYSAGAVGGVVGGRIVLRLVDVAATNRRLKAFWDHMFPHGRHGTAADGLAVS